MFAFCILLMLTSYCTPQNLPIRNTVYGKISGKISVRVPNVEVEEYLGVPYASPPISHLRFKRPQEPKPWKPNILETSELSPACPQHSMEYLQFHKPEFVRTDEDCLYMNIYVPKVDTELLPVLLFIHGGSNVVGMGAMLDGDILAAHEEIIVISFNYRLDVLGFYAAPENGIKGNNGLMDQMLAMQWVQRNIRFFNGDPSKVTIYGHSAGAGDAGLHMLSDLTKGLFRNAIIHSGSAFANWMLSECIKTSRMPVISNNCQPGTSLIADDQQDEDILDLLNGTSIDKYLQKWGRQAAVVIDGEFITGSPEQMFTCGQFHAGSVLLIMARDEGFPLDMSSYNEIQDRIDIKYWIEYVAQDLFPDRPGFQDSFKQELEKWKKLNISSYPQALQMIGDIDMFAPMIKLADMISQWMNQVYTLSFEYISQNVTGPDWIGVQHGWDLFYVFGIPKVGHPKFNYTPRDAKVSEKTMNIIGEFVKRGHWKSGSMELEIYNPDTKSYNKLDYINGQTVVTQEVNYKQPRTDFWYKYLFPFKFTC
ncbi:acetylcholinesterase [Mytilus galloprovincialis]|uniref:Acetylcholinesterase n=1 Tax=Mytilus galloprovincialis TaxID=29158 RepID=A0A8B6HK24_MYTGA|nr:acetylcholinesterase [Mytilus galloprovincialis]